VHGCDVDGVELVAAVSTGTHETDLLEHGEMLRNRLSGEFDVVLGCEATAHLEQCLVVALCQHVEDRSSCWRCQCVEYVGHGASIGKSQLACLHLCVVSDGGRKLDGR